ncbi:hypothetical protein QYF36_002482 [Acer negundo]|nr:hypothetical protein QYF36_002482 [Acer negundo]
MGRRKIEMKMVRDCNSRQVTFSKRRNGLFKKASELATLCAAQVAIVVFSPGGKPFSFGHPSVEAVSQRFLNVNSKQNAHVDEEDGVQNLNEVLTELLEQLEIEKKRGKEIEKAIADQSTCKYKKPISLLNEDELMDMKTALEALRENLKSHVNDMEASSSLLLLHKATKGSDN